MSFKTVVSTVLCITIASYGVVYAKKQESMEVVKSPNDAREYRAIQLDNDLKVLLVSDPETQKSAASLSVGVGLLSDPMEQQGMAHYLEHMLFLGTEK